MPVSLQSVLGGEVVLCDGRELPTLIALGHDVAMCLFCDESMKTLLRS